MSRVRDHEHTQLRIFNWIIRCERVPAFRSRRRRRRRLHLISRLCSNFSDITGGRVVWWVCEPDIKAEQVARGCCSIELQMLWFPIPDYTISPRYDTQCHLLEEEEEEDEAREEFAIVCRWMALQSQRQSESANSNAQALISTTTTG